MAILDFQKPDSVVVLNSNDVQGSFEFAPLETGYAITIGNALRRVLLSSLEGFAISTIRIEGVDHEFSTIKGVVEDVTEIVLNLKQVRFKRKAAAFESEKITVKLEGKESFTAADIDLTSNVFQVLNPELVIFKMEPSVKLVIELTVIKGRGYVTADENKKTDQVFGAIAIDSIFTPIRNVNYLVENYRVEQRTDFEKLTLNVQTDGSISPKEALKEASKILIYHFVLFSDEKISLDNKEKTIEEEIDDDAIIQKRRLLNTKLVDLELSVRSQNCLKSSELETLADLVRLNKGDLMKFRNFGKKSLVEIDELLAEKGLSFGMNISKYKLD